MEVNKPFNSIKSASEVLKKALATVNEAHLANFSRKRVPEIELVSHVRQKLEESLSSTNVFKTVKGRHEKYDKAVFLKQPDVDLAFRYQNMLHGVEFKLLRKGNSFYGGLEEAIAYSTYGVDYSWVVHFFRKNFRNARSYERWMKFVIERSGCHSVGYITSTTQSPKVVIYPREPFRSGSERDLEEVVSKIRKKLFVRK